MKIDASVVAANAPIHGGNEGRRITSGSPADDTAGVDTRRLLDALLERADAAASPAGAHDEDAKLRKAAKDLEGVFVSELLKAMRETVPKDGLTNGGMGEDIFTSMLDQHLAPQVGNGWEGGVGEALYRQLRGNLAAQPNAEGGTE